MLGCQAMAFPSIKQIVSPIVCVVLALDSWNYNNKTEDPLTALPMVSVSVLPNCPCFYREFL